MKGLRDAVAAAMLLSFAVAGTAHAQDLRTAVNRAAAFDLEETLKRLADDKKPQSKPDCSDGIVYDDGKFERGLAPGLFDDAIAMRFDAKTYPAKLTRVCLNWWRDIFDNEVFFELRIWEADGPNGTPGTLIAAFPNLHASRISPRGSFFSYDVSKANVILTGPVYIGPFWDPIQCLGCYLATDSSPKTPRRPMYYGVGVFDDHPPRTAVTGPSKVLGIRAVVAKP